MDKFVQTVFNRTFAFIRGPLLLVLMASIVVSLARRPRRLAPARIRKALPPA